MPREIVAIGKGKVVIREYEERMPGPGEVCIRSELSAEKHGTALTFYKGLSPFEEKSWDEELKLFVPKKKERKENSRVMHLGNMTVGTIVKVGKKVTTFKVNDRVYGYLPFRETHIVEEDKVHPVPSGLRDEQVVCIDPAVVALMSVREGHISLGDKVAVFGLGAIGLLAVQMARLSGASFVVGVDPISARRKLAEECGADLTIDPVTSDAGLRIKLATERKGVDVAIEASGSYKALQQAIRGTRYGGTIVPVSFYHGEAKDLNLGEEWHFNRQVMVSGARVESEPYRDYPRWDRERVYRTVIELFQRGNLKIDGLLQVVDFDDVPQAYGEIDKHPEKWIKLGVRYR